MDSSETHHSKGHCPQGHLRGDVIVAVARALVGTRFRPQGRGAGGLDCVGLVACAARGAGLTVAIRDDLPMRGVSDVEVEAMLWSAGCTPVERPSLGTGDILLRWTAARQVHLAIWTGAGVIEAHAGLRRVVERPVGSDERWCAAWQLPGGDD